MEAFLVSTGVVALGEIGDKTQLLALVLAARYRRPLPIIAGILVATLANHALAGIMGGMVRAIVPAARFPSLVAVVLGTTLGMLLANVPVVLIGKSAATKIPFKAVRIAAAVLFAALGLYALLAPATSFAATSV